MKSKAGAVLVIGAGIGGIKAAFDVAELGYHVYLIDNNPFLGGTLSQLDRQFPTNHCCMCQILPTVARHGTVHHCLRRELSHPNITTLPGSELAKLSGEPGDFTATLVTYAVEVNPALCTNCNICAEVCPIEVKDKFNGELKTRKAIYAKYPLPIPNVYAIDQVACTRCGECVTACPTKAIDLDAKAIVQEKAVGAIILSAGFEEFDPKILMQYGHGRYADVLTSIELERMFSGYGAGQGDIFRPSDGSKPKNIAFLQCVGSRDQEHNYCSSACCMYALKEAMIVREENPDIDIHFFYMDARTYGKGYHKFQEDARENYKVTFTRSRIPVVKENPAAKKLSLRYLTESGEQHTEDFDLVILSIGQVPPSNNQTLSQLLKLELNEWGFCQTDEFSPVSAKPGVFVCGSFSEPKDIPETIAQAGSAALHASHVLEQSKQKRMPAEQKSRFESVYYDDFSEERDWQNKTAVFVCKCGGVITKSLDTKALATFAKTLPNVVLSEEIEVLCSAATLEQVTKKLKSAGASRVVFAACVPYHYLSMFEEAAQNAGIDPGYIRITNIREHAAWIHQDNQNGALAKAKSMLAMDYEFLQQENTLALAKAAPVTARALVIGGGAAGMNAALGLANSGIEVDLIEKTDQLGGQLAKLYYSPLGGDPQKLLETLKTSVSEHEKIHLHFETELQKFSGMVGRFHTVLSTKSTPHSVDYGAIIVATGGQEHIPASYEYGKHPRIMTQQQFKENVVAGDLDLATLKQVVMIQCVESRDEKRPYCSRICCTQAITHALKIKAANPQAEIMIFNRDIMTYGFREQFYTQARESGVLFTRFEPGQEPKVEVNGESVQVRATDSVLKQEIVIEPDLILLSTGIDAHENAALAQLLEVEQDTEGFLTEAEVKFRPVDFHRDGIYLAGLAHSPRFLDESLTQGYAAAARAATMLLKQDIPASPLVAEVNPRRCSGCQMCVSACVYNARIYDPETHTVLVKEVLCQACGACAMVCPNNACKLKGYRDKQVLSVIDAALF